MNSSISPDGVTIRPITGADEIDLFNRLPYTINHELADDLVAQRRRPEWMWVALDGDRVLARVAWWGRGGDSTPLLLDILDIEDGAEDLTEVAQALYETAAKQVLPSGTTPPEYGRFLPADWREDPDTYRAVRRRMGVLENTGAHLTVERLRLEWRPGADVPAPDQRLAFRPALDTDELVALMTRTLDGTLDAHSRADLAEMSPHEAAVKHYEQEFATFSSPRQWWRIGTLGENGEPVGFVVPARNTYHPVIAYLGVVPEHRGHGYVDGLLAEGTRILAAEDVPRIRAATDLGNVPMANAFARAGYVNFERAINMAWQ
ncbi:RimJ/RimL family protein N-acetyltransferase [Micromonospora luteifusca]|uniref:RimJ/RimL family protein N-acetyltransferase n=1 Tax=Micromonospora luteifusca TaxID=709860 RepID=A0ABS2LUP8_9ACTN|nr:GNAT family N-acetyltransferase [Micromonospora luteifusca]MBM7491912.1 RimJ/RimL family protein N-acetyltransferase [Micromonospora luteifusca]